MVAGSDPQQLVPCRKVCLTQAVRPPIGSAQNFGSGLQPLALTTVIPCRRAAATLLKTATEKMMAAQEQARQAEEGAASLQQRHHAFEQQVGW